MASIKQFVTRHFFPIMYLLVAGSFLGLVAELVWTKHWDGIQLVGLAASGIGAVLALLAIFVGPRIRTVLAVLFVVLSISGIVGAVEHNEARDGEAAAPTLLAASVAKAAELQSPQSQENEANEQGESGEGAEEGGEGANIPPLAPLSLAGMSIIGAVTLLADDRKG